jgi:hypothetical protein
MFQYVANRGEHAPAARMASKIPAPTALAAVKAGPPVEPIDKTRRIPEKTRRAIELLATGKCKTQLEAAEATIWTSREIGNGKGSNQGNSNDGGNGHSEAGVGATALSGVTGPVTAADFHAWRDQRDWTAEKYRRFDRGERMPPDWKLPRAAAG